MAIYHFSAQVISRSQGRNVVACAAYRSANKLFDERSEHVHDYTRKQDVAHAEILLPESALEWMKDREALWNAVEKIEKRKDAQLSREVQLTLPRELTLEQNIALAREYVQIQFVSKGMVADLCIHTDRTRNGEAQPHAHVLLTFREVTPEGFGLKRREWNDKSFLQACREGWAITTNRHLALNGHEVRIDHRSLEEQGIKLEPQYKIGSAVAQERLARFEDHQRIARENGDRLLQDPQIAFMAITRQQSTFTHQDLARFVSRHTSDAEQFQKVHETLKAHPELVKLECDEQGRERLTTRSMLAIESKLVEQANLLATQQGHVVNKAHQTHALSNRSLSEEQSYAFNYLVAKGDLKCVVGFAGTGKSYLLGAACEAWEREGYQVHGITLSGIAAENLAASSGIESRTLASRLYYWDKGEEALRSRDIVVIDEAGMLGSRQLGRVLEEVHRHGAKAVLVGDPEQLQAIEAGGAFRAVIERVGFAELTEIRRQREEWQQQATREFGTLQTATALGRYKDKQNVHEFETTAMAKRGMLELWNDARLSDPQATQIMFSYTRADVKDLNEMARALRIENHELGEDHVIETARGSRVFAEQDRVYFLQNGRQQEVGGGQWIKVRNGSLGTIETIKDQHLQVRLDANDSRPSLVVAVDLQEYNQLDHGYAATFHKGQGVTADHGYVLASTYMDSHATYVGMTRHRQSANIFWSREEFTNERQFIQTLGRERGKDISLDYVAEKQPDLRWDALREQRAEKQRENFASFKERFETKNPELAEKLSAETLSSQDKKALAALDKYRQLQQEIAQKGSWGGRQAKDLLERHVDKLSRDPLLLKTIESHQKGFTQEVKALAKEHEKSRDLGHGLGL